MKFNNFKFAFLLVFILSLALLMTACDGNFLSDEMQEMNVEIVGDGRVNVSEGKNYYFNGAIVRIEAIPNEGAEFDSWSGDVENRHENPTTLVMDSEKEIIPIFRREDSGLGSVMIADVSGSMSGSMEEMRIGFISFLERMKVKSDKAALYEFSSHVRELLKFGPIDRDDNNSGKWDLIENIESMTASGYTALWDACMVGLETASRADDDYSDEKLIPHLLVFSDGDDNRSSHSKYDVINKAQNVGIPIYIVGLAGSDSYEHVKEHLKDIAQETGGKFHDTPDKEELEELYQKIYTDVHRGVN